MGGVSRDMTVERLDCSARRWKRSQRLLCAVTGLGDRSGVRRRFLLWPSYLCSWVSVPLGPGGVDTGQDCAGSGLGWKISDERPLWGGSSSVRGAP